MARTPKRETESITDSLKRKESAAAKLKELEYDLRSGKVVDAAQAAKVVGGVLSTVRNRLLGIPSKVTTFLVLATDAQSVRAILDEEINQALGDVVRECSAKSLLARFPL